MDSLGEPFSKLQEAATTYDQNFANLSVIAEICTSEVFASAMKFMQATRSEFSGISTRTGLLLLLKNGNMRTQITKVFAHLVGTALVEVRADSCSVYD
jgi:C4-dicarboxylate transporter